MKDMFLCAVAHPHWWDEDHNAKWDGKIGIWPFVEQSAAIRSSRN